MSLNKMKIILILAQILLLAKSNTYEEIVCGGFVEIAPSDQQEKQLDYSQFEILLLNEENKVVEKTTCSSNGFYLLPIYDRKNYVIRIYTPSNYQFDPQSYQLDLAGKSTEEARQAQEASYNFKFVGFSITEQLKSVDGNEGPEGALIQITDTKGNVIGQTQTIKGGYFTIDKLDVGEYIVSLIKSERNDYTIDDNNSKIRCKLNLSNPKECHGQLRVKGVSIEGKILNDQQNLENFLIFLYGKNKNPSDFECDLPDIEDHPLSTEGIDYLCYNRGSTHGQFLFVNIPNGEYEIHVVATDQNNQIEIEPSFYKFNIQNTKKVINDVFSVSRFQISGRVVDAAGQGLEGVKILLDGEEKAKTNANGQYVIGQIKGGTYNVEGQREHMYFDPLHDLKISILNNKLPDITLQCIDVCGKVSLNIDSDIEDKNIFERAKISIFLGNKQEERKAVPDINGNFCFEVKPGKYNIYPVIQNADPIKQIVLFPTSREITVGNQPILDIEFYRPKVTLQGKVQFNKETSKNIIKQTKLTLSSNKVTLKTSINEEGVFSFDNVLTGIFTLNVVNEGVCFDKNQQQIEILNNRNVSGIEFRQVGFAFSYKIENNQRISLIYPSGKKQNIDLDQQNNNICVEESGTYTIQPTECYQFAEKELKFITGQNQFINLTPAKYLIKGQILLNATTLKKNISSNLREFPGLIEESYSIKITTEQSNRVENIKIKQVGLQGINLVYQWSYYSVPDTTLQLRLIQNQLSKEQFKGNQNLESLFSTLISTPNEHIIKVRQQCQLQTPDATFNMQTGVKLIITLSQPLDNIELFIYRDNEKTPFDQQVFAKSVQKHVLGPFPDSHIYTVSAEKTGFKFIEQITRPKINEILIELQAQKLSTLKITIKDENSQPLSGVLIFISSTSRDKFVKLNKYTNDQGEFITHELIQDEYFIKPVLKEYKFEPTQQITQLKEGETVDIHLSGKQIAFSVYGRVVNLDKDGIEEIELEAIPQSQNQKEQSFIQVEESKSDSQGNFRIRALNPEETYIIKVKEGQKLNSVIPKQFSLKMPAHDVKELEFLVFKRNNKGNIVGVVKFDPKLTQEEINYFDQIRIELHSSKDSTEPLITQNVLQFHYYEFKDVEPGTYFIKTFYKISKTSEVQLIVSEVVVPKDLTENQLIHNIYIQKTSTKQREGSLKNNIFLAPIFILIFVLSLLKLDSTTAFINSIRERASRDTSPDKKKKKKRE